MKAYLISKMNEGGVPDIDFETITYKGYVIAAQIRNDWGCYLFAGTAVQLAAINALPETYAICTQANLDNVIASAVRTRINNWLSARDYPTIPAGWTYRQVINAIFKRLNQKFDIEKLDVTETP